MLSKKQFNAATARLQECITTEDVFHMLRHQLTKNDNDELLTDKLSLLEELFTYFNNVRPLDRRRAENYLSKSLYGKNHSQIAHLMPEVNKSESDSDYGMRYKLYGQFIEFFSSSSINEHEAIVAYKNNLSKRLRQSSPEHFHISYQGFDTPICHGSFSQFNTLTYIEFLDLNIVIEFSYTWCKNSLDYEPEENYLLNITINSQTIEEISQSINQINTDNIEDEVSMLFAFLPFSMGYVCCNQTTDFYCKKFPKEMLLQHKWSIDISKKNLAANVFRFILPVIIGGSFNEPDSASVIPFEVKVAYMDFVFDENEQHAVFASGFSHSETSPKGIHTGLLGIQSQDTKESLLIACEYIIEGDGLSITHLDIAFNEYTLFSGVINGNQEDVGEMTANKLEVNMDFLRTLSS